MTRVLSDQAISRREDDELNVVEFARRLVRPLVEWPANDSLVMGVFAPWGHGKSSALNLLELELKSWGETGTRRAVPIRFNPWMYSDTTTLLTSFFGTLGDALGSSGLLTRGERKALRKAIRGFGEYVVPILGAIPLIAPIAPVVKAASAAFEKLLDGGEGNLRKERDRVRKAMEGLAHRSQPIRVVVLIDDLDRVEDDELRAMLRLVKLVADLPNVSYVLAIDFVRVRDVLASGKAPAYGQAFLEKIFQVPVHLPPISAETLERLSREALREVLESAGLSAEFPGQRGQVGESTDVYHKTVARGLSTLRDRARLVNTLRFMLLAERTPRLFPFDAILIAFLQTFFPDAYDRVRRNKEFLTEGPSFSEIALSLSKKKDEVQATRRRLFLKIASGLENFDSQTTSEEELQRFAMTREQIAIVQGVLEFLFPRALTGEDASTADGVQLRIDNRIQLPERFDRYFQLRPPPEEVSDEYVDEFMSTFTAVASEPDAERRAAGASAALSRLDQLDQARGDSFFSKFKDRLSQLPAELAPGMAAALLDAQEKLPVPELLEMQDLLFASAYRTVANRSAAPAELDAIAVNIIGAAVERLASDPDAGIFAAHYLRDSYLDLRLSDTAKRTLAETGLTRIKRYTAREENPFQNLGAYHGGEVMWRWRDLLRGAGLDSAEIKEYLHTLVSKNPGALPNVLSLFAGWSLGPTPIPGLKGTQSPTEIAQSAEQIFGVRELQRACSDFRKREAELGKTDPHGLVEQFLEILPPKLEESEPQDTVPPSKSA